MPFHFQIMFETINAGGLNIQYHPVLSLATLGEDTGIVVDSGYDVTQVVPIKDGLVMYNQMKEIEIGGSHLTEYLMRRLADRGHSFLKDQGLQITRDIKEKLCYVAEDDDWEKLIREASEKKYRLPDGSEISIGALTFSCPEALFRPQIIGIPLEGIHKLTFEALTSCDEDCQEKIRNNVLLNGGNTLFDGFATRLENELVRLSPKTVTVRVLPPSLRQHAVFFGGALLANSMEAEMWISKHDYEENGPNIIRQKCR